MNKKINPIGFYLIAGILAAYLFFVFSYGQYKVWGNIGLINLPDTYFAAPALSFFLVLLFSFIYFFVFIGNLIHSITHLGYWLLVSFGTILFIMIFKFSEGFIILANNLNQMKGGWTIYPPLSIIPKPMNPNKMVNNFNPVTLFVYELWFTQFFVFISLAYASFKRGKSLPTL